MKILKKVGIVFLILIVISAIGNVIGGSKKDPTGSSAKERDRRFKKGSDRQLREDRVENGVKGRKCGSLYSDRIRSSPGGGSHCGSPG